jgi:nicotinamidase-related amidase
MANEPVFALLVIDVQQGLFNKSHPVYQAGQMLENIHALVKRAHTAGASVYYVQHCDKGDLARGTPGWELHPGLQPLDKDFRLYKEKSNSFEGTDLDQRLKSQGVTHIVVTGMVTHGCVKNGCLGALEHGYRVTLAQDAHSNFSAKASELIAEWNEKLRYQGVEVKPSAEIKF